VGESRIAESTRNAARSARTNEVGLSRAGFS
jgi:hypothetical protein